MSDWPPRMAIRPIVTWPGEMSRGRTYSPFTAKWSSTLEVLGRELRELRAANTVLQIALRERDFRLDGYPRADARPDHPGVILSFDSKHGPLSYPCDRFVDWQDNVRAVALAMEALRKVDRYGVTKRGEQYTGWKQLPAGNGALPSGMTATQAQSILARLAGIPDPGGRVVASTLKAIRLQAVAAAHPDVNNGDQGQWNLLDNATQTLTRAGWLT